MGCVLPPGKLSASAWCALHHFTSPSPRSALDQCSTARQSRPAHPPVAGIRPRRSRPALHRRMQQPSRCGSPSSPLAIGRKLTTVSRVRAVSCRRVECARQWCRSRVAPPPTCGSSCCWVRESAARRIALPPRDASGAARVQGRSTVHSPTAARYCNTHLCHGRSRVRAPA